MLGFKIFLTCFALCFCLLLLSQLFSYRTSELLMNIAIVIFIIGVGAAVIAFWIMPLP